MSTESDGTKQQRNSKGDIRGNRSMASQKPPSSTRGNSVQQRSAGNPLAPSVGSSVRPSARSPGATRRSENSITSSTSADVSKSSMPKAGQWMTRDSYQVKAPTKEKALEAQRIRRADEAAVEAQRERSRAGVVAGGGKVGVPVGGPKSMDEIKLQFLEKLEQQGKAKCEAEDEQGQPTEIHREVSPNDSAKEGFPSYGAVTSHGPSETMIKSGYQQQRTGGYAAAVSPGISASRAPRSPGASVRASARSPGASVRARSPGASVRASGGSPGAPVQKRSTSEASKASMPTAGQWMRRDSYQVKVPSREKVVEAEQIRRADEAAVEAQRKRNRAGLVASSGRIGTPVSGHTSMQEMNHQFLNRLEQQSSPAALARERKEQERRKREEEQQKQERDKKQREAEWVKRETAKKARDHELNKDSQRRWQAWDNQQRASHSSPAAM